MGFFRNTGFLLSGGVNQTAARLLILLVGALVLTACGSSGGDADFNKSGLPLAVKTIGVDGGIVSYTTEDGTNTTISLDIPPGALDKDTEISISRAAGYTEDSTIVNGSVFLLEPEGLIFNKDADLSITSADSNLASGVQWSDIAIHKLVDGNWSEFSTTTDGTTKTALAQIPGFSLWALLKRLGGDFAKPRKPRAVTSVAGDTQVTISWKDVAGANSYNLYYSTTGVATTASTVISGVTSPYVHSGLINGDTYSYIITAVNDYGEGAASGETSATPELAPPVDAFTNFSATAGDDLVALAWDPVNNTDSYNVYRSLTSGSYGSALATGIISNNYTDATAANGMTYFYTVTAQNLAGEGSSSAEQSATPVLAAPDQPLNLSTSAGNAQVGVSWDSVAKTDSYYVYRSLTSGDFSSAVKTEVFTNSFLDNTAINGVVYYYAVSAVNTAGEGILSAEVLATPQVPAPVAPTGLGITSGDTLADLSWTTTAGATSYNIYRSTVAGSYSGVLASTASTGYSDATVTNGTTYYYVITAVNPGGESPVSGESIATPQVSAPSAPIGLGITSGDAVADLSWSATAGAVSYNVYRSTTSGSFSAVLMNVASTSYSDATVTNGTTYYYVVSAVNPGGESPISAEGTATPQVPAPAAPVGLNGAGSDTIVNLNWTPTTGAASYNIYRSTSSGSFSTVLVNTLTNNYSDTAVSNGTAYYYVVSAVNPGGESAVSSEVAVTPEIPPPPATPVGFQAMPGNAIVNLNWTPTTGAASYNIYRSTSSGSFSTVLVNTLTNNYSDTTVSNGTAYYYIVSAVNPGGESAVSSEVAVTPEIPPPPPATPVGFRAMPGNAIVDLRWIASPSADTYNIYRSTSSGPFNTGNLLASGVTNSYFEDMTATVGVPYYYYMTAVNAGGEGGETAEIAATPMVVSTGMNIGTTGMMVREDGTLWGWGANDYGQLGVSSATMKRSLSPRQSVTGSNWKMVSSGTGLYALALQSDGSLWAWGLNNNGQLGIGNTASQLVPQPVGSATWQSVSVSSGYSVGIQADGSLWTWGYGWTGSLGTGSTAVSTSPQEVPEPGPWSSVSAGGGRVLAVKADGTLWSWGTDNYGKHGQGSSGANQQLLPVQVGTDSDWIQVSASTSSSDNASLALKADGTLWAWGYDSKGAFGAGTLKYTVNVPIQIGVTQWRQVSTSGSHTLAIKNDGSLWVWGDNTSGELGNGVSGGISATPVQMGVATNWVSIDADRGNSMALQADNSLYIWGGNYIGQVAQGTSGQPWTPQDMAMGFSQISRGVYHSVGIKADGTLWVWGNGASGQLGLGTSNKRTQVPIQLGIDTWIKVSAGDSHTMAIRSDGTLWAWGSNYNGRLGIGNTSNQFAPVEVCTVIPDCTDTWIDVSAGGNSTGAVRSDNTLWAWGQAANGHIGTGADTTDKLMPTQIGTDVDWGKVTLSSYHLSALKTDGTLWGTGNNVYGSLGTGTFTGDTGSSGTIVTGMVQIGTATTWSSIDAGSGHMVALQSDGSLWLWGLGWKGSLGNGSTGNNATPTRLGVDTWLSAAGGFQFTLGVKSNGTLWAWGAKSYGKLGLGTAPNNGYSATPQQVGIETDWGRVGLGSQAGGSSAMKAVTDAAWSWSNYAGLGTEWYETPQLVVFP